MVNDQSPERRLLSELLAPAAVIVLASVIFGFLFNRETALSYSIGYNLYGATRVLAGEVPYRDFHTLYPPAIVYLNAILFKAFGTFLYNALLGVCIFKVLTTLAIYFCARKVMAPLWALSASLYSIVWLRPNGPFKAVPMHYGSLFLALGLFFSLKYIERRKAFYLLGLGVCLGILTLFKHNIGIYASIGFALAVICRGNPFGLKLEAIGSFVRPLAVLIVGILVPILPVLAYMHQQGALKAMARTLLFGPGEFLLSRLAATPSPFVPFVLTLLIGGFALALYRLRLTPATSAIMLGGLTVLLGFFVLLAPEGPINEIIFYAPLLAIISGALLCWAAARGNEKAGQQLYAVLVVTAAAFMEAFPRFAREQSIAAMAYVGLLLVSMLFLFRAPILSSLRSPTAGAIAVAALPLVLFAMGFRFFTQTFFDRGLHLKSNTELAIDRGKGVYFPSEAAQEIDRVVRFVQLKVPEGGYIFAQSYAGSSYLFLADRLNPSGAQFWGGVG
ncbi:MAG TPA: glycosyltransferase family 39 protein, partial [Blastocatellia bacterium]